MSIVPSCFLCAILTRLEVFGGGPLSTETGDKLVHVGVKLVVAYGGTEFGAPMTVYPEGKSDDAPIEPNEDWSWMRLNERMNPRWVAQGDGTYELQLLVHLMLRPEK